MHDFDCTDAEDMYFDLLAEKMGIAIKIIVVKVTVKGVWCQCKRNLKVLMR